MCWLHEVWGVNGDFCGEAIKGCPPARAVSLGKEVSDKSSRGLRFWYESLEIVVYQVGGTLPTTRSKSSLEISELADDRLPM